MSCTLNCSQCLYSIYFVRFSGGCNNIYPETSTERMYGVTAAEIFQKYVRMTSETFRHSMLLYAFVICMLCSGNNDIDDPIKSLALESKNHKTGRRCKLRDGRVQEDILYIYIYYIYICAHRIPQLYGACAHYTYYIIYIYYYIIVFTDSWLFHPIS